MPSNSTNKSKSIIFAQVLTTGLNFFFHFSPQLHFTITAASVMNSWWIFPSVFFISLWRSQECVQVAKDEPADRHVLLPWQHMVRQWRYQLHWHLAAVLSSHRNLLKGDTTRLFFSSLNLPTYIVSNVLLLCPVLFCYCTLATVSFLWFPKYSAVHCGMFCLPFLSCLWLQILSVLLPLSKFHLI